MPVSIADIVVRETQTDIELFQGAEFARRCHYTAIAAHHGRVVKTMAIVISQRYTILDDFAPDLDPRPPNARNHPQPSKHCLLDESLLSSRKGYFEKSTMLGKITCILVSAASLLFVAAGAAKANPVRCDQASKHIPAREAGTPDGSAFAQSIASLSEAQREQAIEAQLAKGDVPAFIRNFVPVNLMGRGPDDTPIQVTVCVAPDYLALGSDTDFLFVPMRLATALRIANRFGALLPTSKIVDAVYDQAEIHLSPQPLPAGDQMRTTAYYVRHNALVRAQRELLGASLGELIAGDKKDLVITNRLWRMGDRVAIYGWHRASHDPIQPMSTVHGARYADYSHGVRLVSADAYVDGTRRPLLAVLGDTRLASILNAEGMIADAPALLEKLSVPPSESAISSAAPTNGTGIGRIGMSVPAN